jgi:hypothetical protein
MSTLSILFLGNADRSEFQQARASLDRWGAVQCFADADSAAAALSEDRVSPDVLVVAQSFPSEFSHQAIDRLRRLAPLARVLGLLGSWCEGEMRSGSPLPATVRTYWHHWPARSDRQFCRLAMGQSCSWGLPSTATDEERLLAEAAERSREDEPGQVLIRSSSREMADWLAAACRGRGLTAVWQRGPTDARGEGAIAGVFDGTDLCCDECEALGRFVIALRPAPTIAILSFPRIEEQQRALSAGASFVLSKPLLMGDLLETLELASTAPAMPQ